MREIDKYVYYITNKRPTIPIQFKLSQGFNKWAHAADEKLDFILLFFF